MKKILLVLAVLLVAVNVQAGFLGIKKSTETISFPLLKAVDDTGAYVNEPDSAHILTYADNGTEITYSNRTTTWPFSAISLDTSKIYGDTTLWFADVIGDIDGAGGHFSLSIQVILWTDDQPTQTFASVQIVSDSLEVSQDSAKLAAVYSHNNLDSLQSQDGWVAKTTDIDSVNTAIADANKGNFKATGFSTLSASDNIGINWADVNNQTTAVNFSNTTTNLVNTASTVTDGAKEATLAYFDSLMYGGMRGMGIWIDAGAGNTNTVIGTDGTKKNPVSTLAAAKTIADNLGATRYYITARSSLTLAATHEDWEFVGEGVSNQITLGSQDTDGSYFFNLLITGTKGGTEDITLENCVINDLLLMDGFAFHCGIDGANSIAAGDDVFLMECFSMVAGNGTPSWAFGAGICNMTHRGYSGGVEILNMDGNDALSVEGHGQVIVNANCTAPNITVRGHYTLTDNDGATTWTKDAVFTRQEYTQWGHAISDTSDIDGSAYGVWLVNNLGVAGGLTAADVWNYAFAAGHTAGSMGDSLTSATWIQGTASGLTAEEIADAIADTLEAGTRQINYRSFAVDSGTVFSATTNGIGFRVNGGVLSGTAFDVVSSSGHAARFFAGGGNGHGLGLFGNGTGEGLNATGGTGGYGLYALGQGSFAGIGAFGGTTGDGIYAYGGATSGSGILAEAQTSGSGFRSFAAGNNHGTWFRGGTNGDGLHVEGGSSTGDGLEAAGTGGESDIEADIAGTITTVTTHTNELTPAAVYAEFISGTNEDQFKAIVWGSSVAATLQSLVVSNSSGDAVQITSTGGNGDALQLVGDGTGYGLFSSGASGAYFAGSAIGGAGLWAQGDVGIEAKALGTNKDGFELVATGTGEQITTADLVDAMWDELQSGHITAGTFGKYLDTEVSGVGGGASDTANIIDAFLRLVATDTTAATMWSKLMVMIDSTQTALADANKGNYKATGFTVPSDLDSLETAIADANKSNFMADVSLLALETSLFDPTTDSVIVDGSEFEKLTWAKNLLMFLGWGEVNGNPIWASDSTGSDRDKLWVGEKTSASTVDTVAWQILWHVGGAAGDPPDSATSELF